MTREVIGKKMYKRNPISMRVKERSSIRWKDDTVNYLLPTGWDVYRTGKYRRKLIRDGRNLQGNEIATSYKKKKKNQKS